MKRLQLSGNVFVTSDTHFSNPAVIRHDNRPFESIEHHDAELIRRWNEVVTVNDTIVHLGDFALTNQKNLRLILTQLNGNIIFLKGNHDAALASVLYRWTQIDLPVAVETNFLSSGWTFCHYPMESWNGCLDGHLMVHGHTHSQHVFDHRFRINACVTAHDYRPVTLQSLQSQWKRAVLAQRQPWPTGLYAEAVVLDSDVRNVDIETIEPTVYGLGPQDPLYLDVSPSGKPYVVTSRSRPYPGPSFSTKTAAAVEVLIRLNNGAAVEDRQRLAVAVVTEMAELKTLQRLAVSRYIRYFASQDYSLLIDLLRPVWSQFELGLEDDASNHRLP